MSVKQPVCDIEHRPVDWFLSTFACAQSIKVQWSVYEQSCSSCHLEIDFLFVFQPCFWWEGRLKNECALVFLFFYINVMCDHLYVDAYYY